MPVRSFLWLTDFAISKQNGEVIRLYNQQGELHWQAAKASLWGHLRNSHYARSIDPSLGFAGQLRDDESGLCYNRFRYYDPQAACYISPDPIGILGGENNYGYVPNPVNWIDPLGLSKCKSAAGQLPKLKGKSITKIEKELTKQGFTKTKVSNSAAKNQVWSHADGSEVRIHPYGNESMYMKNGQLTPKSGLNAHIHKQNPLGDQLDDLGQISLDPNKTHIGVKNIFDYPTVRGRPHGVGS